MRPSAPTPTHRNRNRNPNPNPNPNRNPNRNPNPNQVWAYALKHITELRYRLLKQREIERTGVSDDWTTRLPNQIVGELCSSSRPAPPK